METDDITYERPGSFQSDKSFFYTSCDDIGGHESDEYDDVYTNVSAIRENPVMSAPPPAFGPARTKMFSTAQLARRKNQFRIGLTSGHSTPESLRHVPIPHGADWCLWEGEDNLPPECGYHPNFGNINNCSAKCHGGWCQRTSQMEGRDYMS
jgi:hypothetical protein